MILEQIFLEASSRQAQNSLRRPIADSPEKLSRFWSWFGASKAIDKDKRPLVVYHGTTHDIQAFDADQSKLNKRSSAPQSSFFFSCGTVSAGTYAGQVMSNFGFTDLDHQAGFDKFTSAKDYDAAGKLLNAHATNYAKRWNPGANMMPVYLRIIRPLEVDAKGRNWNAIGFEGKRISTNDIVDVARSRKNDGVIILNVRDHAGGTGIEKLKPHTVLVVFDPKQIKSAIGNSGSFDKKSTSVTEDDA